MEEEAAPSPDAPAAVGRRGEGRRRRWRGRAQGRDEAVVVGRIGKVRGSDADHRLGVEEVRCEGRGEGERDRVWGGLYMSVDEDTTYITRTSTPAAPEAPRTSTPAAPEAPQAPSTPLGAPPAQTSFPPPGPITRARARELNYIMLLKNEGPEA
jgi:hypothetical protein